MGKSLLDCHRSNCFESFDYHDALASPSTAKSSSAQCPQVAAKLTQFVCRAHQKQAAVQEDDAGLLSCRLALTVLIGAAAISTKVSPADVAYGEADLRTLGINSFSGELPRELGNLTELIVSSLGSNSFSSSIPSELGKLVKLEQLLKSLAPKILRIDTRAMVNKLNRKSAKSPQLLHRGKPNEDIKHIFSTAIKTSKMFSGKKEGLAREPKWLYPKCHRQPGHTECGYYVILYMLNIIESGQTTNLEQISSLVRVRTCLVLASGGCMEEDEGRRWCLRWSYRDVKSQKQRAKGIDLGGDGEFI
ncbi:hypothetical protein K1719_037950 [Acacia pycnantha]|nr:hypothetical protein K1719_037950 [Acacia pycnantha]